MSASGSPVLPLLNQDQLATWRVALAESLADPDWQVSTEAWRVERSPETLGAIVDLLRSFVDGQSSLKQFQTTFDKRTRTEWNMMGLKGQSAAMFLNTLAKHIPDHAAITAALQAAIPAPENAAHGRAKMSALVGFVGGLVSSGAIAKRQVQAARIPYFLSACWHLQVRQTWPIFYTSMRAEFERQGIWQAKNADIADDYMTFRARSLELADALGLDLWGIERLCLWMRRPTEEHPRDPKPEKPKPEKKSTPDSEGSTHTHAQWVLAKLGKQFRLKVWIAQNDHARTWNGESLGSYSIAALPMLGIGEAAQRIVRQIDVIWLKGANQVVAAFEVEYTTSIYSGLLRMSDLTALAPNAVFPIYVVAPEKKLGKVHQQLERRTFQQIELHQRCQYLSIEDLLDNAESMLAWATDPSAIDKLAHRVPDIDPDTLLPVYELDSEE